MKKVLFIFLLGGLNLILLTGCGDSKKESSKVPTVDKVFPSDIIQSSEDWSVMFGNGKVIKDINALEDKDYFYTQNDTKKWVVYKTPNSGTTSPNSSNTRSEMGQKSRWIPEKGGKLTGNLKVMHVSTSGDARVAAAYSVVIGQIHSDEGHENEPIKIFYKKFPGHEKGSVYWNYEINTEGDNSGRWDYSEAVWGYDMSVIGTAPDQYPPEPENGIALGEEFSYEINVYQGVMYLTFMSEGHETKTFAKNLLESEYTEYKDIPQQILTLYASIGRDGVERKNAYAGELQYFKQGAYNQTNGKDPATNMVWSGGSKTYGGDLGKQYANGSYTEVWFSDSSLGPGTNPNSVKSVK